MYLDRGRRTPGGLFKRFHPCARREFQTVPRPDADHVALREVVVLQGATATALGFEPALDRAPIRSCYARTAISSRDTARMIAFDLIWAYRQSISIDQHSIYPLWRWSVAGEPAPPNRRQSDRSSQSCRQGLQRACSKETRSRTPLLMEIMLVRPSASIRSVLETHG